MKLLKKIKCEIESAEERKAKYAAMLAQVLLHADELSEIPRDEFCRCVGLPKSYGIEFSKMQSLKRELDRLGYSLVKQ